MTHDPPSLLELAARVVKTTDIRYDDRDVPRNLLEYLDSAHSCVNLKCKGHFSKFFIYREISLFFFYSLPLSLSSASYIFIIYYHMYFYHVCMMPLFAEFCLAKERSVSPAQVFSSTTTSSTSSSSTSAASIAYRCCSTCAAASASSHATATRSLCAVP